MADTATAPKGVILRDGSPLLIEGKQVPDNNYLRGNFKRVPRFRLWLKDGFHTENNAEGEPIIYQKNDVFLSTKRLDRRDPNKFQLVDAPLRGGHVVTQLGQDIEDDDDDLPGNIGFGAVPTVPRQQPPQGSPPPSPVQPKQSGPAYDEASLRMMTLPELKREAEDNEIDTAGLKTKDDFVRALLANQPSPA